MALQKLSAAMQNAAMMRNIDKLTRPDGPQARHAAAAAMPAAASKQNQALMDPPEKFPGELLGRQDLRWNATRGLIVRSLARF